MRPSCGTRFSAMLMFDMILRRLMNRGLQPLRRIVHFLQHAVDAVPHAQPLLQRLDVNIARPVAVRLHDDQAHQLDDRRVGIRFGDLSSFVSAVLPGRPKSISPSVISCSMFSTVSSALP